MSGQTTGSADVEASSDGVAIRPFTIDVPEEELTDLRRRINATKWPGQPDRSGTAGHRDSSGNGFELAGKIPVKKPNPAIQ